MTFRLAACAALLALLVTGCADATGNKVTVSPTGDPAQRRSFTEHDVTLAQRMLADAPTPPSGYVNAVIMSQVDGDHGADWQAVVLGAGGAYTTIVYAWCNGDDDLDPGMLVGPGDLIEWSTDGGDTHVCPSQLRLIRKAGP